MVIDEETAIGQFIRKQFVFGESDNALSDPRYADGSIIDRLFRMLTRGEFRRSRIDEESSGDLRGKLRTAITERTPIKFAIPFGGYKYHKASSFPDPDWAEVFNLSYLIRYVLPVASAYEHGVLVQYTYSSGVMDLVSNLPPSAPRRYMKKFRELIGLFQPQKFNIRVDAVDIAEFYDKEELFAELKRNYDDNTLRWSEKFSPDEREKRVESARRNLMMKGAEDLSVLDEDEWNDRCLKAAMWCEALDSLTHRRRFNKYSSNIQLVFVRGPARSVHIGSCDTSSHHFWSGAGVAERRGSTFLPRILSEEKIRTYAEAGLVSSVPCNTPDRLIELSAAYEMMRVLSPDNR